MSSYDGSKENYSICIAFCTHTPDGRRIYKWHRIADYHPSAGQSLWPSLVEDDFSDSSDKRTHPNHLYNPGATEGFDERTSDFYVFEWRPNPKDLTKTLSRIADPSSVFPRGCTPKEVIIPHGVNGQRDLRMALAKGIPFEGRTSSVFYLVFDGQNNGYLAARCETKNFDFSDGAMRLKPKLGNLRDGLSVPVVLLKHTDIIEARHYDVMGRRVYADMGELDEVSRIPLRPLSDYAPEYVRWFARNEDEGLSRTDRQKIATVIEEALKRPEALEEYVTAKVPDEEIAELLRAIVASARQEKDPVRSLIRDELLKDDDYAEMCRREVLRQSEDAIAEKKKELESIENDITRANNNLVSAENKVKQAWEEYETVEEDVKEQRTELDGLVAQREELLNEYETDIALRLGLRAAASTHPVSAATGNRVVVERGLEVANVKSTRSLVDALDKNLTELGVRACPGALQESRRRLAMAIVASLSATRFLALPSPLAERVASALSAALFGKWASKAYVPTDCREVGELLSHTGEGDCVTLIANVIDAVNEGVLLSLLSQTEGTPVVLSFTSHASADLLAKEMWDRLFFPPAESLLALSPKPNRGRCWRAEGSPTIQLDADCVLERMTEISDDLKGASLAVSSLLLPASVMEAGEDLGGLDLCAVSQHLALVGSRDDGSASTLMRATDGDFGLMQILKRLQRDV